MKRAVCIFLTVSACGGAGSSGSGARTPDGDDKAHKESIGDLAANQGGLAALGGAGNREEGGTGIEVAMAGVLRADEVDKKTPVKLDGVLREWHDRVGAKETLSGKTEGLSLGVAVQYDDAKLYVGGEVGDRKLARTSQHGEGSDHVSLVLAFPSGRGALKGYELGLWAGKPGESPGAVKWKSGPHKGQDVAGAKIVESDTSGGYTFEAAIPWSSFPEARLLRVGLRGALRYHDADAGGVHGVLATGAGEADKPSELAPLPTAPEQSIVEGLLAQQNLDHTAPRIDVFADVTGDEQKERISVFGKFFTICGPRYRGGHQFFWRAVAGELAAVETREVTGRGKDDLVVRRRVTNGTAVHEMLEVWTLAASDEPTTVFAHEIAITDGKKKLSNAVRVSAKEIEVSVEPASGWDAATFKEPRPSDAEALLFPWGTVKSRTFRFEKGKFAMASEVAQAGSAASGAASASATKQDPLPRDVPTPDVKKGSDLSKQLLEAYLKEQGLPAGTKPRFDLEVNVDGDAKPERVVMVGRDILVFGPGFLGGRAYAKISLTQFADDKDVGEMTARDLTGDGGAELVVRGVRRVTAAQGGAGDRVDVDALFVYQVKNSALGRVFAIETGREQSGKRVQGLVQFVPARGAKSFEIDVRPGVAKGWTDKTYPWPQDKPGGSMEPLLLPWGKIPSLRYTWNGTQFTTNAP
jgi:hypothetical protein